MIVGTPSSPSLVFLLVESRDTLMVVSGFGHEVFPKRLLCGHFDLQLMESVIDSIDLLMDIQLDGIIEMVMVEELS